jgi:hypothetical protein
VPVTVPETPTSTSTTTTPPVSVAAGGRGKHARQAAIGEESDPESGLPARLGDEEVLRSADAMLAMLAAEQTKPLPGLSGRLDSTGARVALMAGGMALIALVLFLVMVVIGAML